MSVSSLALVSLIACSAFVTAEAGATRQLQTFQDVRDYVLKDFGVISAVYDLSRCYVPKEFAAFQDKKLTSVNGRHRISSARNNWEWGLPPSPNYWQFHAPPVAQRFGPWRPRFRRSAANLYRNKIYVEHLNDVWLWVRLTSRAEELRATDVFVEDRWIFVQPKLYDRGEAILNIVDLSGGEIGLLSNFTATCKIGEGAQFFAQDPGVAKEEFNTYEDMKGAVRTGKELIARALTTECPGPSWEPFGIADFVAAYKVYAARIENEGTDEEKLVFNFYLFSDQFQAFAASPVVLETVAYTMKPDGSAEVALGPIDLTTFKIPFKPIYNCTIGKTFFLGAIASDRNVGKYNTYEDVLHAAKTGQTINTIMDARLCNWKGGRRPDATEINMRRFSPWVHATEKPQYGNFIGFFDLNYNNLPTKKMEKYWVFDNDTVLYEILTIDPERKTQVLESATCTMGCSIKFGSSERPREEILCADGLRAALLRGEYVTYMLDYDRCAGPEYVFDAHGGGLLEHAEIDPMTGIVHSTGKAIATFLTSGEAVRVQQPVTVHPDGTVVVVAETRVTDTTFRKIGETATFTCKIGESAFFFA